MKLHYLSLLLPQFLQSFYLGKMMYLIKSFYYGYLKNKRNASTFDHNWNGVNINRHAIINKGIFHINKIKNDEVVVDSHPWTIVERKLGTGDQFSDILSVLLVINKTDSFFKSSDALF